MQYKRPQSIYFVVLHKIYSIWWSWKRVTSSQECLLALKSWQTNQKLPREGTISITEELFGCQNTICWPKPKTFGGNSYFFGAYVKGPWNLKHINQCSKREFCWVIFMNKWGSLTGAGKEILGVGTFDLIFVFGSSLASNWDGSLWYLCLNLHLYLCWSDIFVFYVLPGHPSLRWNPLI